MTPAYRNAIGSIESDNDYAALGPTTKSGDRAYGRYQVMGANIPDWTQRHYGTRLTPDQFLKNKEAQDAVFDGQFGGDLTKYGNPQDAASMWFSGRPMSAAGNSSDGYNTVPQYVAKFNKALMANPNDDEEDPGELSPQKVLGNGVLFPAANDGNAAYTIGSGLTGLGASLAGISSPGQAYALTQQAQMIKKAGENDYKFVVGKNGEVFRVDPSTGKVESANAQGGAGALSNFTPLGDTSKTGDEYLATIPEAKRATVQGWAKGTLAPPTGRMAMTPETMQLIDATHRYDPSFDAAAYQGRVAARKDWAQGKSSEMTRSANQTLGHTGDLLDKMEALQNRFSPLLNSGKNWFNSTVLGDPAVTSYKLNAHAVVDELGKMFKGANLSDHEIKSWEAGLQDNMSPSQQRAATRTLMGLYKHALDALEEKRRMAVGDVAAADMGPLLSKQSQGIYDRAMKWAEEPQAKAAPKVRSIKEITQ